MLVVERFENFGEILPYVDFKITLNIKIEPEKFVFKNKSPPRFEQKIANQVVRDCSKDHFWFFELPLIIDPNLSPVKMTAQPDPHFFELDLF